MADVVVGGQAGGRDLEGAFVGDAAASRFGLVLAFVFGRGRCVGGEELGGHVPEGVPGLGDAACGFSGFGVEPEAEGQVGCARH